MTYPFVSLCISFCLGIFVAETFRLSFFLLFSWAFLFLLLSILFINKSLTFKIFILAAVFFLGAAILRNAQTLPSSHMAKRIPFKSDSVFLIGVIESDPMDQKRNTSFILRAEKIKENGVWKTTCGKVLVKVFAKGDFSYGDRFFFIGKVYRPFSFSKDFDYRKYLAHQGIYSILSLKKGSSLKRLSQNAGNPLKAFSFRIKHKIRNVIVENLSPFCAGVLNAFILGDRQDLPRYIMNVMVNLGVVHIIAISGFNVGIVAFILLLVLKMMRIPRRPRYLLAIFLLILHCLLTGANAPVVRATIMAIILLMGFVLEREVHVYNSLALAALIILVLNPCQLFGISFQLSFLSVVFIVIFTPKIESLFPKTLKAVPWIRFFILTFSVSLAAWAGLLPLIAYYFKIITPIAVLANMFVVPLATMIIIAGLSLASLGILVPHLAPILGASNEFLILLFFKINYLLVQIPGAYFKLPQIPFAVVLLYYGLGLAGFFMVSLFAKRRSYR
ncbi:MAG: ComEC/Rec2 family competence protein [Candidatus Omnitrophota bacterium]